MTTEQLQRAIHATLFRPFVLRADDGQQLPVPHPDFIAHPPGTRTVVVTMANGDYEVVDLLLVVGLMFEQPAASP
jgi:hypothetical protein